MKSSLARLLVFFAGFLAFIQNTSAQSISPDIAQNLRNRAMSMHEKFETAKSATPSFSKTQITPGEVRVVDVILPDIEKLLLAAADQFEKAADKLPGLEGQECLRNGCGKLKEAQKLIHEARQILRMDGVLRTYGEMLDEIKQDIKDAVEDAGCRRANQGSNPWIGKYFRSEYSNPQGRWISGNTQIHGDRGNYGTNNGETGTFDRITFRDNNRIAEGYWRFQNGATGWFSFNLNHDGRSFYGSWGNGDRIGQNQVGTWKGNQ